MNHSVVVCDMNKSFVERLTGFVNKRHLCPYLMESFTDVALLREYGKKHRIEVLIIDEFLYTEQLKDLNIGKVFLLTENQLNNPVENDNRLYKYLPIPEIISVVMSDFAGWNKKNMSTTEDGKIKIIGGFTPVSCVGNTSFILTLAAKTAEKRKVFYLNISSTYGLKIILDKTLCPDLSDVMYCVKNGNYHISEWPDGAICQYGMLNMIMPAVPVSDLQCINEEDWVRLLEIISKTDVDYIFLDMDESTAAAFSLLDRCDLIYSVCTEDYISESAFSEFNELVNKMGISSVSSKIKKVYPPVQLFKEKPENYLEALKKGVMGDYAAEVFS